MKYTNLIGQKFFKLNVIEFAGKNNRGEPLWLCRCDCGNTKIVKSYNLKSNNTKSCGCIGTGKSVDTEDLVGKRSGSLTITKFAYKSKHRDRYYYYLCDCGNTGIISKHYFGIVKQCKSCRLGDIGEIPKSYLNRLRVGAKKRNLAFELEVETLWELFLKQKRKCALSGIELNFDRRQQGKNQTASLDRIDSTKGYIQGNVQWIHKELNFMKQDFSEKEFIDWCYLVINYYEQLNSTNKTSRKNKKSSTSGSS